MAASRETLMAVPQADDQAAGGVDLEEHVTAEGIFGPGVIDVAAQGQVADMAKVLPPEHALHRALGHRLELPVVIAVAVVRTLGQEEPEIEHGEAVVAAVAVSVSVSISISVTVTASAAAVSLGFKGRGEDQDGGDSGGQQGGLEQGRVHDGSPLAGVVVIDEPHIASAVLSPT